MSRGVAAVVCVLATAGAAGGGISFEASVLPVLEEKCFQCHREEHRDEDGRLRRPKGGLRLDGRAWIERGADGGPVLAAGDAAASPLYTLTVLGGDDPDRMPKRGEGLTAREAELLRRWIDDGADFGGWTGAPADGGGGGEAGAEGPAVPPRVAAWIALGRGVDPAPETSLDVLRRDGARVEPVIPGSPLLRVSFPAAADRAWDDLGRWLAPAAANVAWLDLARTAAGDEALAGLPDLPRLVHLDLRGTAVTDRGVRDVARFGRLAELNLFGTAVTDGSVEAIAAVGSLREARLGGTAWTTAGIEALRTRRPEVQVVWDPEFGGGE